MKNASEPIENNLLDAQPAHHSTVESNDASHNRAQGNQTNTQQQQPLQQILSSEVVSGASDFDEPFETVSSPVSSSKHTFIARKSNNICSHSSPSELFKETDSVDSISDEDGTIEPASSPISASSPSQTTRPLDDRVAWGVRHRFPINRTYRRTYDTVASSNTDLSPQCHSAPLQKARSRKSPKGQNTYHYYIQNEHANQPKFHYTNYKEHPITSEGSLPRINNSGTKFRGFCLPFTLFLLSLLAFFSFLAYRKVRDQYENLNRPLNDLHSFAVSEIANNDLAGVADLTVDGLKLYAQATCMKADSAEALRNALRKQLMDLPNDVREQIIEAAVIEGMETTNSRQNAEADTVDTGKAYSYIAFWSTTYNGERALTEATYSTCIMAAGVDIKIGEDLAGFDVVSQEVQKGLRPCECNMFWCKALCPEYGTVTSKRPIFKRHKLKLKDQVELHRWMVKQAVDRAQSLLDTKRAIENTGAKSRSKYFHTGWKGPSEKYFLGSDDVTGEHTPPKSSSNNNLRSSADEL